MVIAAVDQQSTRCPARRQRSDQRVQVQRLAIEIKGVGNGRVAGQQVGGLINAQCVTAIEDQPLRRVLRTSKEVADPGNQVGLVDVLQPGHAIAQRAQLKGEVATLAQRAVDPGQVVIIFVRNQQGVGNTQALSFGRARGEAPAQRQR